MREARWNRIKEIYHTLQPLAEEERERRLDELCGDDPDLREEVLAILAADEDGVSFLGTAYFDAEGGSRFAESPGPSTEGPGDRIGPYKLLQMIGEGGFGVVFMAEQLEPIRRRVALKVIKPGMDSKQVIARFEAERQALAMMDHPNIAKVLDAGTTPTGRPYFVMELVKGIPITTYCDNQGLDTHERLELFMEVCRAAEHAHQAGIIHRDIKPTNVLVTLHDGVPVPKVIDFGVAKAIRSRLTESTLFTEFHQFIGTPAYMSPEQAAYEGLEVDPRSDVYSLGVLLYELLTGTTPIDSGSLKRAAYVEVLRILKEEEPPRPSTRVTTVGQGSEENAKRRGADPQALARLLRGDLDWIVMKALEKDRGRRYESASELAADIGRYFEERPIEARPPSFGYKAQKLLRRRRGPFAAAAVIALLVTADIAYLGWTRWAEPATAIPPANQLIASVGIQETCEIWGGVPSPDGTRMLHNDQCSGDVYVRDIETGTMEFITEFDVLLPAAVWLPDGERISVGPHGPFDAPTIIDLETRAHEVPPLLAGLDLSPADWSTDGKHVVGVLREEGERSSTVLMSLSTGERTLVREGGSDGGERFSPDGRYLLFTDGELGSRDLFVLEVESGERWPLVESPEDEERALWSPDGTTVAYRSDRGLLALPVSEGRPKGRAQLVTSEDLTPLGWNEHGFYYLASKREHNLYRIGVDPQSGRATGRREPMPLPDASPDPVSVAWGPDMRLAVTKRFDGNLHIMGEGATTTLALPEQIPHRIWWSADGREVLMSDLGWGTGEPSTVHGVDVETGAIRELFPAAPGRGRFHLSRDEQQMIWVGVGADDPLDRQSWELKISEFGGREGRVLAGPNEHGVLRVNPHPQFSPDGSWILYARHDRRASSETGSGSARTWWPHTAEVSSLWVIRPDGSDDRKLVEAPFWLAAATWDPTGSMIAYQAADDDWEDHLYVVSVEDGRSHLFASMEDLDLWRLADWSPDGAWLAVRESAGATELWMSRGLPGEGQVSERR